MALGKRGLRPLSRTVLKEIQVAGKKKAEKPAKPKQARKEVAKPEPQKPAAKAAAKTPVSRQKSAPKVSIGAVKAIKQALSMPKKQVAKQPSTREIKAKVRLQNPFTDREEVLEQSEEKQFEEPKPYKRVADRVPTGIPGLDEVMEGGFEEGSYNLVAGGAGSGKSIFAMQFLVTGIEKYNEPGIYVTFEEKKENVYRHMLAFGWDLAKYEKLGKFEFIEYTPEQVKKMLEEGGGLIESLIKKINAKRIVLDSITAFSLLFKDELNRRQGILSLIDLMRKWSITALLTAEFEPNVERPSSSSIEFEVDSIILLYYPREGDTRKRALEILKMRGTEHSKKIFPLRITDKGITIYPKERIF